jgi:sugar/nucleoside kinase (ribokinase family)
MGSGYSRLKDTMASINIDVNASKYQIMLGVGGIGSGVFFALDGDHTLGREESRSGHFLDRRDYCKLHIISHYVKVLLGPDFEVMLIGKVGKDDVGQRLLDEMRGVGLNLHYVETCPGERTLYSFCYLYPDGSGGNMTVDDSACSKVDSTFIARAESEILKFKGKGIALAVPEVPLEARRKLLQLGTTSQFFRVAAFTSVEMGPAIEMGLLGLTDLLSINLDEAAASLGIEADRDAPFTVVETAVQKLHGINPAMMVIITGGKWGSWIWDGNILNHLPAFPVPVVNTAGAGDAFLAGVIVGLVANLTLHQAQELGTLVAAASVTSPHTINPEIEQQFLLELASQMKLSLSENIVNLLQK